MSRLCANDVQLFRGQYRASHDPGEPTNKVLTGVWRLTMNQFRGAGAAVPTASQEENRIKRLNVSYVVLGFS